MTEHKLDSEDLSVVLRMNDRVAYMVRTLLRKERRKRQKQHEKEGFVPEPGKYNMNEVIVLIMEGLIKQLDEQLNPEKE